MRRAIGERVHDLPWAEPGPGAHVTRAAAAFLLNQVESGVGCPLAMTFAAVPALRDAPALATEWLPKILSADYDPPCPGRGQAWCLVGMAMTEKQGGSDVRANSTRALAVGEGAFELVGHKWFCSAPMSDAFLTLAQTEAGLSCFLVPRWLPDGRNRVLHPTPQGQARQPLQRLGRDRVCRGAGRAGRRGRSRRALDHQDGAPHPARCRDQRRGAHAPGDGPGPAPCRLAHGLRARS